MLKKKVCAKCKVNKLASEYHKSKEEKSGLATYCKECHGVMSYRNNVLKRYGLTLEDYNEMFKNQEGRCAICGKHQSEFSKRLFVDHNHTTGKVRALLCSSCNMKVGLVEKSKVERIKEYLDKHDAQ